MNAQMLRWMILSGGTGALALVAGVWVFPLAQSGHILQTDSDLRTTVAGTKNTSFSVSYEENKPHENSVHHEVFFENSSPITKNFSTVINGQPNSSDEIAAGEFSIINPLDNLLEGAVILDSRQRKLPNGTIERVYLAKTSFKYPLLRVEEVVRPLNNDEEEILERKASVADHVIVKKAGNLSLEEWKSRLAGLGVQLREIILPNQNLKLVEFPAGKVETLPKILDVLNKSSDILYAEADQIVTTFFVPNDPRFEQLWGLRNTGHLENSVAGSDISATSAWSVTRGSRSVKVAVIDTGVDYNHPDLIANIWTNPNEVLDGSDSDGNGFRDDIRGWNFFDRNNNPIDRNGHGTHCAGTIGAVSNNALGVTGVCWEVSIIPVRFMSDSGAGALSDAVQAVDYARVVGAHILSNSWGSSGFSQSLHDVVMAVHNSGGLFIAAAGNDGRDNDHTPTYPANFAVPSIISVAATDASDSLASFSNFGTASVHIAAPGVGIVSTFPEGRYRSLSGTSMATPHVAGVAALIKSQQPHISRDLLRERILSGADRVSSLEGRVSTGGRLNAFRALLGSPAHAHVALNGISVTEQSTAIDGIFSPGETVYITPEFKNVGSLTSYGIQATLSSSDPNVTITQNTVHLNSLAPGNQQPADSSWIVSISSTCPSPRTIHFQVRITDASGLVLNYPTNLNINRSYVISGIAVDKGTQQPVSGVQLTLEGPRAATFTTSSGGYFSFPVVEGNYTLSAAHANYFEQKLDVSIVNSSIDLRIELGRPVATITPTAITAALQNGAITTRQITVTNNGTVPLEWSAKSSSFEYAVRYSTEANGPQFTWNDISATGTEIPTNTWFIAVYPDWSFPLYGEMRSYYVVSPNGFLTSTENLVISDHNNRPIPSQHISVNSDLMAYQWTRMLSPQQADARSFYQNFSDRSVFQYTLHAYRNAPASRTTGQVVIYRDGRIIYYYQRVDRPDVSTVGIQDSARSKAHQVVHNAAFLQNNMAIEFTPLGRWMHLDRTEGVLQPGQSVSITATMTAISGLQAGNYSGAIFLETNDSTRKTVNIPVTLTIGGAANNIIQGRVTDILTEQPIHNAAVQYSGPVSGFVTTSQDGQYIIMAPNGTYNLTVSQGTYSVVHRTVTLPPDRVENFELGRPEANISPLTINLGTLAQGQTNTRLITITNSGGVTLEVFAYDNLDNNILSSSILTNARQQTGRDFVDHVNLINSSSIDWLSLNVNSIEVPPNSSASITVTGNTSGLSPGTYNAEIYILTNDFSRQTTVIPVSLTVSNPTPPPTPPPAEGSLIFNNWLRQHFTAEELADPELTAPEADFSGDGVPNLVAYAFGINPRVADPNNPRLPRGELVEFDDGTYGISYSFVADTNLESHISYEVKFSQDMKNWITLPAEVVNTNGNLQTREVVIPLSGNANQPDSPNRRGIVRVQIKIKN